MHSVLRRVAVNSRRLACIGLVVATIGLLAPSAPALAQSAPASPGDRVRSRVLEQLQRSRLLEQVQSAIPLCAGRDEPADVAAFLRTELYFGSNRPNAPAVTSEEFQSFLDTEITPRFPDGLTLLTGLGQFRGSSGVVERERSMVLILLYPVETAGSSGEKIEQIRTLYESKFQQESVLRADEPVFECVSF
jgi:Protein of unknown function (DUF3574)